MWKEYNPNPKGLRVGDCAIRAVSAALNLTWERAYYLVTIKGYDMADMPSSNAVWGAVLKDHGFTRKVVPEQQRKGVSAWTASTSSKKLYARNWKSTVIGLLLTVTVSTLLTLWLMR